MGLELWSAGETPPFPFPIRRASLHSKLHFTNSSQAISAFPFLSHCFPSGGESFGCVGVARVVTESALT